MRGLLARHKQSGRTDLIRLGCPKRYLRVRVLADQSDKTTDLSEGLKQYVGDELEKLYKGGET